MPSKLGFSLAVAFILFVPLRASASNCSSLLDCWGSAGAAAGAAAGAGAVAGTSRRKKKPKKKKDDPCAGERRAVQVDQGTVYMYQKQLELWQSELNDLRKPAQQLLSQASALAPAAQSEVATHFLQELAQKILELAAELLADPAFMPGTLSGAEGAGTFGTLRNSVEQAEAVENVKQGFEAVTDPSSQIPGKEYVDFGQEMADYYNIFQHWGDFESNIDGLADLASEENLPAAKQFVDAIKEIYSLMAKASQISNKMAVAQVDLKTAEDKLKADEAALAQCEAEHANG